MAAGDVVSAGPTQIANAGYLDIQPAATREIVVHNIYYSAAVEFEQYDGVNFIKFDADSQAGARLVAAFHCTNARRIRIKNVSGANAYIGYDGIVTRE